jgi:hypothetical protein
MIRRRPRASTEINTAYEILGDEKKAQIVRRRRDRRRRQTQRLPVRSKRQGGFGGGFDPGSFRQQQGPGGETVFESFSYGPGGFQRRRHAWQAATGPSKAASKTFSEPISSADSASAARGHRHTRNTNRRRPRARPCAQRSAYRSRRASRGAKKRVHASFRQGSRSNDPGRRRTMASRSGCAVRASQAPINRAMPSSRSMWLCIPTLRVEGANLRTEISVPLEDAILGGSVRVPTLSGAVDLKIPPQEASAASSWASPTTVDCLGHRQGRAPTRARARLHLSGRCA